MSPAFLRKVVYHVDAQCFTLFQVFAQGYQNTHWIESLVQIQHRAPFERDALFYLGLSARVPVLILKEVYKHFSAGGSV